MTTDDLTTSNTQTRPLLPWLARIPYSLGVDVVRSFQAINPPRRFLPDTCTVVHERVRSGRFHFHAWIPGAASCPARVPKVMDRRGDLRHMCRRRLRGTLRPMTRMLLAIHIAGGIAALLSMGIPLVGRKGGRTHRRAGWVFVAGMAIVSITSLMLAADRFVTVPYEGARTSAVFLGYLGLLTGGGVSAGIRVLRHKARTSRHRHPWDVAIAASIPSLGLALGIDGLVIGAPLLVAFSLVGIFSGMGQLAYWLRPPDHRMHWWFAHMDLMIGSCIAATTAFFVNNSGRIGLGPSGDSLFIWLAPTAVGVPALVIWTRSYRRRFDAAAAKNARSRAVAVASAALTVSMGNPEPRQTG